MEKVIWTKDMVRELAKIEVRHGFTVAGIVACRVSPECVQFGVAWREGWEENQGIFFSNLASQCSPLLLFKTFLRSLARRGKSSQSASRVS